MSLPTEHLINELQSFGVRLADPKAGVESRRGGAGPSDHKALTIDGVTIMAPVHTAPAFDSPYIIEKPNASGASRILRDGLAVAEVRFPERPRFYDLKTEDGVPYSHIATLHGRDVLATTVLQTCIRYQSRTKTCQFCAIGQSLAAGRTVERKTPAQLAEVARAAVELDRVKHMVMTTGTPPGRDRGAAILCESAAAVKAAVDLPIQAQCEPPDHDAWFERLARAGVDSLGMHLEVVTPELRRKLMPGKSEVSVERYFKAFAAAVPVFGRGQVSTYILAGLGDSAECDPQDLRAARRAGRLPVRRSLRADLRHAARKPCRTGPRIHARHSEAARHNACRQRAQGDGHQGGMRQMRRLLGALDLRAEARVMIFEPFERFSASEFRVKFAASRWEREGAYALRRQVFCGEQGLFGQDDRDAVDDYAITLVALSMLGVAADHVVGTVRIHEDEPGLWRGSRLAVAPEYRRIGAIGATLIRLAVSSAHAMGARTFLAHVQAQNAPLFQHMHWETMAEVELHGRPHMRMRADLDFYPPCHTPEIGYVALRKAA